LFVLAFCIIERDHYADFIAPELLALKLKYFQDPHIILHEREIRKAEGNFKFLTNTPVREAFLNDLNHFMEQAQFTVIASVIHKERLQNSYKDPTNPYELGTQFCLERLRMFLDDKGQTLETMVTFEARGKKEDRDLELSFLRITNQPAYQTYNKKRFGLKIIPKISNSCGLQIADLMARPIGRHILAPKQSNRAFDIIKQKLRQNSRGKYDGYGFNIFP
jgi:hypothetical protein